jgi:uncharacterized protein (DUF1499 family)
VRADERYLHAECRSRIFGFVDDLEFLLQPEARVIAFRAAARSGYYNFGVNRARIDALRTALQADGVIE